MESDFQIFHISDPNKSVFGAGDAWACPRIYRFILKSENVGQTTSISDPGRKLIVYTLPSIWQYPFFQNDIKIPVFCQNRHPQKIGFCLYCIAYWYCLLAPVIPVWNNSTVLFRCAITAPCGCSPAGCGPAGCWHAVGPWALWAPGALGPSY